MAAEAAVRLTGLDLAEQHRYGDPGAFEEVYRRFEGMVFNLALRMSGDPALAEDLTQEAFLRVHRHLGSFRGKASLKTWIYRVALNCFRTQLKRRGFRERHYVADPSEDLRRVAAGGPGPEGRAIGREAGRRIAAALAAIPFEFREAVVLRDAEGLSYEEIAGVLGVRLGTVRSRIARGRDRLRGLLGDVR